MAKRFLFISLLVLFSAHAFSQVGHQTGACSLANHGAGSGTNSFTLTCSPNAANHALILSAECYGTGTATAMTISASPSTGWTFTQVVPFTALTGGAASAYAAITPNTTSTTFTFTFTGATNCTDFTAGFGDEFTNVDTTGGTTTFYAHGTPNVGTAVLALL